jgi:hypothetical protein
MPHIFFVLVMVLLTIPAAARPVIGERPTVETHLDQAGIDAGEIPLEALIAHGRLLFEARFNISLNAPSQMASHSRTTTRAYRFA